MSHALRADTVTTRADHFAPIASRPAQQAYVILYVGYIALPILAGADKVFQLLTSWESYLAPQVTQVLSILPPAFMQAVGVIEIVAGLLIAFWPRVGAYVVAL